MKFKAGSIDKDKFKFAYLVTEVEKREGWARLFNSSAKAFGCDIETGKKFPENPDSGLSPYLSFISLIQFYDAVNDAIYVFDVKDDASYVENFNKLLGLGKKVIFHYAQFDVSHLMLAGVKFPVDSVGDSMVLYNLYKCAMASDKAEEDELLDAADFLKTHKEKYGAALRTVVGRLFGYDIPKDEQTSNWTDRPLSEKQLIYAALDPFLTYKCADSLLKSISKEVPKLKKYYAFLRQTILPVTEMMLTGVFLNKETHGEHIKEWEIKLKVEQEELLKFFTGVFNINSTVQLSDWLLDNLKEEDLAKWPKSEKTGRLKTDAKTLVLYRHLPFVERFLAYKKLEKLNSAFGDTLLQKINPVSKRIHSNYSIGQVTTGRMSSYNPNLQQCYSKDTELLTMRGWTLINEVTELDLVAQWDKDESIQFVFPKNLLSIPNASMLVHVHNTQTDLMVTGNHRCLVRTRLRNGGVYSDIGPTDIPSDRLKIHAGTLKKTGVCLKPSLARLIVVIQADGSFHDSGIDFSFVKPRKIERFKQIMKEVGNQYFRIHHSKDENRFRVRLVSCDITRRAKEFLTPSKEFSWDLLSLDAATLRVITDELRFWDGLSTRKANSYSSAKEQNADVVQALYTLNNLRATKRLYRRNKSLNANHSDIYCVDTSTKNYSMTNNININIVPYKDTVYCLEVPSSYLITRRNNKVTVSGNCPRGDVMRGVFEAQSPEDTLVCADLSQIELRVAACLSRDPTMLKAYRLGLDLHSITASKILNKPIEKVSKEERNIAKAINFSLLFGSGAYGIRQYAKTAYNVDLSESESFAYLRAFFDTYPVYAAWQKRKRFEAERVTKTICRPGKIRALMDDQVYTCSVNHPVQGGAASIIHQALINIYQNKKPNWKLVNCVHDEIILEVDEKEAEAAKIFLVDQMTNAVKTIFPEMEPLMGLKSLVEAKIGKTWALAK